MHRRMELLPKAKNHWVVISRPYLTATVVIGTALSTNADQFFLSDMQYCAQMQLWRIHPFSFWYITEVKM